MEIGFGNPSCFLPSTSNGASTVSFPVYKRTPRSYRDVDPLSRVLDTINRRGVRVCFLQVRVVSVGGVYGNRASERKGVRTGEGSGRIWKDGVKCVGRLGFSPGCGYQKLVKNKGGSSKGSLSE